MAREDAAAAIADCAEIELDHHEEYADAASNPVLSSLLTRPLLLSPSKFCLKPLVLFLFANEVESNLFQWIPFLLRPLFLSSLSAFDPSQILQFFLC